MRSLAIAHVFSLILKWVNKILLTMLTILKLFDIFQKYFEVFLHFNTCCIQLRLGLNLSI